ncbi:MAG: hypothetical protein FJ286_17870 [Planctomycetes bacterium]|nr:hypothetical protein [Planctomycetota bacterium]
MTLPANVRSAAIRVTGVSAALAVSFLAASTRAEVASPWVTEQAIGTADNLLALAPGLSAPGGTSFLRLSVTGPSSPGYHVGPPKPAFVGSILVQPAVPATPLSVHKSGFKHLTGVVRNQTQQ